MNYATRYKGYNKVAQRCQATTTAQTVREFANTMKRRKDAAEIQKDKCRSVPVTMLPMLFESIVFL
ncbi:hypothetical protein LWM68_15645 [Niabella sp. W65]|nr:hypothetical protein [Niabella sp. W65]MCH7364061.1 hypothetical protein [Niabella sp. W65]